MNPHITSWSDLAALMETHKNGNWIYRGESSTHAALRPKAGRVGEFSGASRKRPYKPEHERQALKMFKREGRPYLSHQPQSDIEWMAIAQHHGMSTRLLDWSESLLVAAYFAVFRAGTRGDGIVFAVQDVPMATVKMEKDPFGIKSVRLYKPPHISPRIPAQRSVFTFHPNPVDDYQPNDLVKITISANACGRIKNMLDRCAVNEASLFPDIDGLSRYIGWRYKWAKLEVETEEDY